MPGKPPILVTPIPPQVVNEGASFGPLNLNDFIQSPDTESGTLRFVGELGDHKALPKGLICTSNGTLAGIPGKGTKGSYVFLITAANDSGTPLAVQFSFTIQERMNIV